VSAEIDWVNVVNSWGSAGIQLAGACALTLLGLRAGRRSAEQHEARAAAAQLATDVSVLRVALGRTTSRAARRSAITRWRSSWDLSTARIHPAAPEAAELVRVQGRSLYVDLLDAEVHDQPWVISRSRQDSAAVLEETARDIAAHCCGRRWRKRLALRASARH
jgi:hypothetical protein